MGALLDLLRGIIFRLPDRGKRCRWQ